MSKRVECLGVMLDCSRGAVYTVDALKKYIDVLAKMGYNSLQLYTEDTYEVKGNLISDICAGGIRLRN